MKAATRKRRATASGLCRVPACERVADGYRGVCDRHYQRFSHARAPELEAFFLPGYADRTFANNCPTCKGGGIVCPYFAVDGRVVEWRCIAGGHEPDTYLGRNFPARRAAS